MSIIQFHRFPASLRSSDGFTLRRSAIVVKDGIAEAADAGGRVVRTRDDYVEKRVTGNQTELVFADGTTWKVGPGDGCGGCTSPLKRWYLAQLTRPIKVGT